jgi:multidrug efflux pump subunit AcrA (membrane-fusion protein)
MTVTAAAPQVIVALDASLQLLVKPGDHVQVDLPDGRTTTPGTVTDVSSVATVTPNTNPGANGGPRATVSVTVSLTNPSALGHLDQLPVTVEVATQSVKNVLAVPVNALLALGGGGYAVEVVQANGSHRLAGVQTGIYDSNLVQVSGPGIAEGMKVVVPAQ